MNKAQTQAIFLYSELARTLLTTVESTITVKVKMTCHRVIGDEYIWNITYERNTTYEFLLS